MAYGNCGNLFTRIKNEAADPGWLRDKKVRFLVQDAPKRIEPLPDVPLLSEFVTDESDRKALEVLSVKNQVGRPYLFPPGVPAELVTALRTAFMDTMKDAKFLEDAKRLYIATDPMTGSEVAAALKAAYSAPKDAVAKAAKLWPPAAPKKK